MNMVLPHLHKQNDSMVFEPLKSERVKEPISGDIMLDNEKARIVPKANVFEPISNSSDPKL